MNLLSTPVLGILDPILDPISNLLGWILNILYEFLSLINIENAAVCIILFTFLVKALMIPLTVKQQKFTKISSKMNPELMKIQAKYKGKRDEISMRKQQLETQAIYQKYGASPASGCLPMLITLPILFALYQVIYRIPHYIDPINDLYNNIATSMQSQTNYAQLFTDTFKIPLKADSSVTAVIDALTRFDTTKWKDLAEVFPNIAQVITTNSHKIMDINSFFGVMNIANQPVSIPFPGLIIPILAVVTQWYSTKQMNTSSGMDKNAPGASATKVMTTFMPLFSGFICLTLPIGIGLYWVAGAVFQILQQFAINRHFDKMDIDKLVEESVEKAKKKKKHIDYQATLEELAKKQTKSIGEKPAVANNTKATKAKSYVNKANNSDSTESDNSNTGEKKNYKPGSIVERANLLKGMNSSGKGDK